MIIVLIIIVALFIGCKHDPIVPSHDICFDTEVLPILISKCSMCHSDTSSSRGRRYILTDYNSIVSRNIDVSNPTKSKLYEYIKTKGY